MSEINYVCCRWRDAITDPPPDGWIGTVIRNDGDTITAHRTSWDGAGEIPVWIEHEYHDVWTPEPGDQWLDVTDLPAVPRADVQAAVDRLFEAAARWRW